MANENYISNTTQLENGQCTAEFKIHYSQFLNAEGKLTADLPEFAKDKDALIELYRVMVLNRTFDNKAIALQRTGKMGTFASSAGQEAVAAAIGHAMRPDDVLLPMYREYAAQLQRGVEMSELFLYWGGDERGMGYQNQAHDLPIAVPIATQITHAAGVAKAFQLRKQARVAVTIIGDGGTSKGDFYEGLNLAGVMNLPMVVVINNNQWAISVPRRAQTATYTIAQKAIAAGIPGEQVDGNDILAMRERMSQAIEKARAGDGPTVIEALTYRMGDHTTADDATRYRKAEELEAQKRLDPIKRFKTYLMAHHDWTDDHEASLLAECSTKVEHAVKVYLETPAMPPESMFDCLYEKLPKAYQWQRDEVAKRGVKSHG